MESRKVSASRHRLVSWIVLLPLLLGLRATAFGATDRVIYDDALAGGWQNWSWATVDLASNATAHTGAVSIAVTPAAWSALYLRSADAPVDTNGYLNFTFWVHGGTAGGQTIQVVAVVNDAPQPGVRVAAPTAGTWQKISVPLASLDITPLMGAIGFSDSVCVFLLSTGTTLLARSPTARLALANMLRTSCLLYTSDAADE